MNAGNDRYTLETLTDIRFWSPRLLSFRTTRDPGFRFTPGQFARLGLETPDGVVSRPYSVVSASYDDYLEFFSVVVPGGAFTSRLVAMQSGERIRVERQSYGLLTLDRFADGRDLWLLATGTGVAPYLSMLAEPSTWAAFENIVLVYSARAASELAYNDTITQLAEHPLVGGLAHRLRYLPTVTREQVPGLAHGRITTLLASGALEQVAGLPIDAGHSRLMICGNPAMVDEVRQLLQDRGLSSARTRSPGQYACEHYW